MLRGSVVLWDEGKALINEDVYGLELVCIVRGDQSFAKSPVELGGKDPQTISQCLGGFTRD